MSAATSTPPSPGYSDATGLAELRGGTLRTVVFCVYALAFGIVAVGVVDVRSQPPERWLLVACLALGAFAAQKLQTRHLTLASMTLVSALILGLGIAIDVYPAHELIYLTSAVVMVCIVLLGVGVGSALALAASVAILAAALAGNPAATDGPVGTPIGLIWAGVLLSWLAARPTITALDWSWQSYVRARETTDELRVHQSDLARVSKSLNEAYVRLEQVNFELERARQSSESARRLKAEFAAAISHELRTPLNLVIGFTEMLMQNRRGGAAESLPSGVRADVETIYRNACHISSLIDDVLDLSRIEAHRMALQREPATLASIVDEAVATVAPLVADAGLTLDSRVPDDLPPVNVDRTRIKQILINLLNNAVRSTDEGGLTVAATRREGEVVVSVTDTGVGVAPEALPHLFDEFSQFGGANRRGRSGLGLAVSRQFAELHGGAMWATSEPGRGSTFSLSLPLQASVVATAYEPLPDVFGRMSTPERPHSVAVIGDDAEATKLFGRYLDGFQVIAVPAASASALAEADVPPRAVVLTDDAAIESWRDAGRRMPVPAIACKLSTTRVRAGELGVAAYLVKPVSREQLGAALGRIAPPRGIGPHRVPVRVLVVEDDPEMARLLIRMVRSLSRRYQAEWAPNGAEGLARARENRPDAVLLDLLMPTLDGYGVIDVMRADPTLAALPIIVVTARERHEEPILAASLTVSRPGGLTISEVMRCARGALDCLVRPAPTDSAPAPRAVNPD
jgi:signal transduction histidine kinase/CheY-like chemotaxis protein